jgi:plasmid stability protein
MATLHIRDLPEDVHAALKRLAGSDGISMEALVRRLLSEAIRRPRARKPAALQALVRRLYEGSVPTGVVDELLADRRQESGER